MKLTNKLRFIQKDGKFILQQWWTNEYTINLGWEEIHVGEEKGEWRDVPVQKECE